MIDALLGQVRNTALIVGVVALVGLILQKKSLSEIISGTTKTILGFMIFNIGSGAISGVVTNFSTLFNTGFGIQGITTQVEVATSLALNTYGLEVALVFVLGFVFNLLVAKFTKFKAIFLTGQHFLYFACVLALVFISLGFSTPVVVVAGGLVLGICGAALPSLAQPFMNKITGSNDIAMGHFNLIGYTFAGYVGKLFSKESENKDSSNVKVPEFFKLFRDFVFSVAVFMVILFYVATFACVANGQLEVVKAMSKNDLWYVFPLLQGIQFAAGMSVLIYGVRQFIAAITEAFVAISDKYIPNSIPAVDCPAVFPYAPTAVIIGFIGSLLGGFVGMYLLIVFKSPVVLIPAAGICFFSGGTSGVFGNAYGGWKGALLGSFLVGIALVTFPIVLYPAFANLGIADASFPNVDYNIVGAFLYKIIEFFQGLLG